ncbi:MAG: LmeA family phospholipid-binding protein [Selenomonadaceae bacterium]|nr:LmeA family phospholipid-binding protein [Selenomonadaceae bacterium]
MKKLILIAIPFLILFLVCIEFILPPVAENSITQQVKEYMKTDDVKFSIDSSPRFMIAFGKIEHANLEVHNGYLDDYQIDTQIVEFKNTELDVGKFFFDGEMIFSKDDIDYSCIVTDENLKKIVESKLPELKLNDFKLGDIKTTPEGTRITGTYSIFGRDADVNVAGKVLVENGKLLVRMTDLNVNSPILRQVNLDNVVKEIVIIDNERMPYNLKLDRAEMHDGSISITASKRHVEEQS